MTDVTRRQFGAVAGAGILTAAVPGTAAAARPLGPPRTRAVSMAMHIHACFSEGGPVSASMMTHLDQATKHGVDVIWWTEHDFRMEAYGYYQGIAFDGDDEGHGLIWFDETDGTVSGDSRAFVTDPVSPAESGRALAVRASGAAADWGGRYLRPKAGNSFYRTNLTDTTITVDVLAQQVGPDAEAVVEVQTSYRPATDGRDAGPYVLHYRLGPAPGRRLETPLLGVVEQAATGGWQTLALDPLADLRAFWPDMVASDSSLFNLRFGIRARAGATGAAVFDHLTITRTRDPLTWAPRLQDELMATYAASYPAVQQHQSSEISLVRHLNVFMDDFQLFPYTGPPSKDDSPQALAAMVRWYQDRGALVQYNHPPQRSGAELVAYGGFGTDLVEIGRDADTKVDGAGANTILGDRIDLFDVAARNSVFLTATGVSDDHQGRDWVNPDGGMRYVTSVWSRSTSKADLHAALAAGQAWWHDLLYWPAGAIDLVAEGRSAMGSVLRSARAELPVDVHVAELPADATVQVVVGACDGADVTPSVQVTSYPAAALAGGRLRVTLGRGAGAYLRVEVHDPVGRVIGFGNPLWLLDPSAPVAVPAARRFGGR